MALVTVATFLAENRNDFTVAKSRRFNDFNPGSLEIILQRITLPAELIVEPKMTRTALNHSA